MVHDNSIKNLKSWKKNDVQRERQELKILPTTREYLQQTSSDLGITVSSLVDKLVAERNEQTSSDLSQVTSTSGVKRNYRSTKLIGIDQNSCDYTGSWAATGNPLAEDSPLFNQNTKRTDLPYDPVLLEQAKSWILDTFKTVLEAEIALREEAEANPHQVNTINAALFMLNMWLKEAGGVEKLKRN